MNKKRAVVFSIIAALGSFAVVVQAFALGVSIPNVGGVNVGGSDPVSISIPILSPSSGSSNQGSSDTSSPLTTIGSTVDTLLDSVLGIPIGGSASMGGGISSVVQTLPVVGNTATSISGNGSALISVPLPADLISTVTPGGLTLGYPLTKVWNTTSTVLHAGVSNSPGTENSTLLQITAPTISSQTVTTPLVSVQDWSHFKTLGIWVLPNTTVKRDEMKLIISQDVTGIPTANSVSVSLPDLQQGVWQYVSLDLSRCPQDILSHVASYGFSVVAAAPHQINFYPPQLGPGVLHHFHMVVDKSVVPTVGKIVARVLAEDRFNNVLSTGSTVYSGARDMVFSDDNHDAAIASVNTGIAKVTVDNKPLNAKVRLNFANGISDPVTVTSPIMPLGTSIGVSDGTVNSNVGDFSMGLSLARTATATPTLPVDAAKSVISVNPMSGTVGTSELITITAMDQSGNPRTVGGDVASAVVSGANATTIPLTDLLNGTYQGMYVPAQAGIDTITATLNNTPIGQDADGISDGIIKLVVTAAGSVGSTVGGVTNGVTGGSSGGGGGGIGTTPLTLPNGKSCDLYMTQYVKLGANNNPVEVQKLQQFLRQYAFGQNVRVTGIYDSATFEAVKEFQKEYVSNVLTPWNAATPTGYVYILTLRQINIIHCMNATGAPVNQVTNVVAMKAPSCPYFTASASKGTKGGEVAKAQQFLKDMGMLSSSAPLGTYGTQTWNAVKQFQMTYLKGVTPATGNWGPLTMQAANKLLGCAAS